MGSGCGVYVIVIIPLALIMFIASLTTPWYVIGTQSAKINNWKFYFRNAVSDTMVNNTLDGSDNGTHKERLTYEYDALKPTMTATIILVVIGIITMFAMWILTIIHHKSGGMRVNKHVLWIVGAPGSLFILAGFLSYLSFTSNIAKEDFFCPSNSTIRIIINNNYNTSDNYNGQYIYNIKNNDFGYCNKFMSNPGGSGLDYGPGSGFWVCLIGLIFMISCSSVSFCVGKKKKTGSNASSSRENARKDTYGGSDLDRNPFYYNNTPYSSTYNITATTSTTDFNDDDTNTNNNYTEISMSNSMSFSSLGVLMVPTSTGSGGDRRSLYRSNIVYQPTGYIPPEQVESSNQIPNSQTEESLQTDNNIKVPDDETSDTDTNTSTTNNSTDSNINNTNNNNDNTNNNNTDNTDNNNTNNDYNNNNI